MALTKNVFRIHYQRNINSNTTPQTQFTQTLYYNNYSQTDLKPNINSKSYLKLIIQLLDKTQYFYNQKTLIYHLQVHNGAQKHRFYSRRRCFSLVKDS
jgi:DNA-dependent RNA polymerase auxiliary subunit epsilon